MLGLLQKMVLLTTSSVYADLRTIPQIVWVFRLVSSKWFWVGVISVPNPVGSRLVISL
jgi:hypothetical protein